MEKQGFKHTELGMIPTDWIITELNSLVDKKRTIRYGIVQPGKYDPNGKFLIRGQDYSFGWVNLEDFFRVSPQIEEPYKNARVKKGDVIITIVGASTGKVEVIPSWLDQSNLTQTTARIAVDSNKGVNYYIKYYLEGKNGQEQVKNYIKGAAQPGLNCGDIEKFLTILPPTLTEQKAIATALSDVDDLISNLDKLISKKKAIKQGTMQQLLTPPHNGGKRLAGFTGEWVEKKLGDCLKYEQPTKYIVENSDYEGQSQTPVLTAGKSFLLGYTDEDFGVFNHYPVIIFDDFTTSNQFVNFSFKVKSSAMKMLQPVSEEIDIKFMFSIMNQIRFSLGDDHKRRWIAEYSKIDVFIPEKDEQQAISNILSDMEDEINELETKKIKFQDIKQGMMQELLTGKTRLV